MSTLLRAAATADDIESYRKTPQFAVSLPKLVVMSLCTFGFYELYWCYKHWQAEQRREEEDLSPFWRAVFAPLWGFSLFGRIQDVTTKHGISPNWSATTLGLGFLLLNAAWRLPDPLWLVSFLALMPLLPVQHSVNRLNATLVPDVDRNDRFTGLNVLCIVIGAILLVLVLAGLFLPEPTDVEAVQGVAA